jgi:hypothetical protein
VFIRALHWSLSWARTIKSIPHPISPRTILVLSSLLCLYLPNGHFLSDIPTYILYTRLFPHACYVPCLSHRSSLYHSNYVWGRVLCRLIQPHTILSLFDSNILLSVMFSYTLSLCFPLNVRNQVSYPCKTTALLGTGKVSNSSTPTAVTFSTVDNRDKKRMQSGA